MWNVHIVENPKLCRGDDDDGSIHAVYSNTVLLLLLLVKFCWENETSSSSSSSSSSSLRVRMSMYSARRHVLKQRVAHQSRRLVSTDGFLSAAAEVRSVRQYRATWGPWFSSPRTSSLVINQQLTLLLIKACYHSQRTALIRAAHARRQTSFAKSNTVGLLRRRDLLAPKAQWQLVGTRSSADADKPARCV